APSRWRAAPRPTPAPRPAGWRRARAGPATSSTAARPAGWRPRSGRRRPLTRCQACSGPCARGGAGRGHQRVPSPAMRVRTLGPVPPTGAACESGGHLELTIREGRTVPRSGSSALAAGAIVQAILGGEFVLGGLNKLADPQYVAHFRDFVAGS